jgi:hypothetical protein
MSVLMPQAMAQAAQMPLFEVRIEEGYKLSKY